RVAVDGVIVMGPPLVTVLSVTPPLPHAARKAQAREAAAARAAWRQAPDEVRITWSPCLSCPASWQGRHARILLMPSRERCAARHRFLMAFILQCSEPCDNMDRFPPSTTEHPRQGARVA